MSEKREACGRCAMTTVVDATAGPADGESADDDEADGGSGRDPFGGARIEIEESALRRASPAAWLAVVTRRLDDAATRVVRGR